jgi:catechol 2,3-dioxygenase-like lactoylglutathione lyase family enzyme
LQVDQLGHLVLTVEDVNITSEFYTKVLGMEDVTSADRRKALTFGSQKINLHEHGDEIDPKSQRPTPSSADLCFITRVPISEVIQHVRSCGVEILEGPVNRTGVLGPITSIYFRNPDGNLIEVSNYSGAR